MRWYEAGEAGWCPACRRYCVVFGRQAASIYQEVYGDAEGNIPASFQIIYLAGWSPH